MPAFPNVPENEVPKRLRRSDVLRPSTLSRFFLGLAVAATGGCAASSIDFASSTDPGEDATADATVAAVTAERGGVCGMFASLECRLAVSFRDDRSLTEPESVRQNRRRLLGFVSDATVSPCEGVSDLGYDCLT